MLVSLRTETIKLVEGNASGYQVNPVIGITGEGRAEFLRTWGPGFDQEGVLMCVEACDIILFNR